MRVLALYSETTGHRKVAGRDIPRMVGQIGLIESRNGGKTWAQYYAAIALRSFGTDLARNAVWQSLSPDGRQAWRALLDPARFYDREHHHLINLAENYYGVAARIAAISWRLGLLKDRAYVDQLLDEAAAQFVRGAMFSDDALPTGRYDRYSEEYARAVYEAAEIAGRKDIQSALEPSLKMQMRLWWDLVSPDGYAYSWGRSLGDTSYSDSLNIVASSRSTRSSAPRRCRNSRVFTTLPGSRRVPITTTSATCFASSIPGAGTTATSRGSASGSRPPTFSEN
jgi:hypothetical protein